MIRPAPAPFTLSTNRHSHATAGRPSLGLGHGHSISHHTLSRSSELATTAPAGAAFTEARPYSRPQCVTRPASTGASSAANGHGAAARCGRRWGEHSAKDPAVPFRRLDSTPPLPVAVGGGCYQRRPFDRRWPQERHLATSSSPLATPGRLDVTSMLLALLTGDSCSHPHGRPALCAPLLQTGVPAPPYRAIGNLVRCVLLCRCVSCRVCLPSRCGSCQKRQQRGPGVQFVAITHAAVPCRIHLYTTIPVRTTTVPSQSPRPRPTDPPVPPKQKPTVVGRGVYFTSGNLVVMETKALNHCQTKRARATQRHDVNSPVRLVPSQISSALRRIPSSLPEITAASLPCCPSPHSAPHVPRTQSNPPPCMHMHPLSVIQPHAYPSQAAHHSRRSRRRLQVYCRLSHWCASTSLDLPRPPSSLACMPCH